ncbi:MAG: hypothetical protein R3C44_09070 [Chloroflexota bacterium]
MGDGAGASAVLEVAGQPTAIIDWVAPLFGLWAIYRGVSTFIQRNLKPAQARTWMTILRLVILALVVLQSLTLLDNIGLYLPGRWKYTDFTSFPAAGPWCIFPLLLPQPIH